MDDFWKYVSQHIDRVDFTDIDETRYGLLFSNESTVIMGKIKEMCNRIAPSVHLIFRPEIFQYPVPDEYKHLLHKNTACVAMLRNLMIISNGGDEFANHEVEKLYAAHKHVTMPDTWFVVKYAPAKRNVGGAYEYDGHTLSTNNTAAIIDALGEYHFSKLHIPLLYCSNPLKPMSQLYVELGLKDQRCVKCNISAIHTNMVGDVCCFCSRLKPPV